jgi:hypothetical protein
LKELGSLSAVKTADVAKLAAVIGKQKAVIVVNHFKEEKKEDAETSSA